MNRRGFLGRLMAAVASLSLVKQATAMVTYRGVQCRILSHEWKRVDRFESMTITGQLVVKGNPLLKMDTNELRDLLVIPPVLPGFRRSSSSFMIDWSGTTLDYKIVDNRIGEKIYVRFES